MLKKTLMPLCAILLASMIMGCAPKKHNYDNKTYVRHANGETYTCQVGANIPCMTKANNSKHPNQGMKNWCKQNKNSAFIPAYATGRASIYEWQCKHGLPQIKRQIFTVDQQGFIAEFWHKAT